MEIVFTMTGVPVECGEEDAARLVAAGSFAYAGGKPAAAGDAAGEPEPRKPLSKMNKAELLELAAETGVEAPEGATNAALAALLRAAGAD